VHLIGLWFLKITFTLRRRRTSFRLWHYTYIFTSAKEVILLKIIKDYSVFIMSRTVWSGRSISKRYQQKVQQYVTCWCWDWWLAVLLLLSDTSSSAVCLPSLALQLDYIALSRALELLQERAIIIIFPLWIISYRWSRLA